MQRRWPSSKYSDVVMGGDDANVLVSPWTTTHEQLSDDEKISSGVTEVSFAIEYVFAMNSEVADLKSFRT